MCGIKMVTIMSCNYLSTPRCGLIDKMIEPKVLKTTLSISFLFTRFIYIFIFFLLLFLSLSLHLVLFSCIVFPSFRQWIVLYHGILSSSLLRLYNFVILARHQRQSECIYLCDIRIWMSIRHMIKIYPQLYTHRHLFNARQGTTTKYLIQFV